jgi:hypothetical protein
MFVRSRLFVGLLAALTILIAACATAPTPVATPSPSAGVSDAPGASASPTPSASPAPTRSATPSVAPTPAGTPSPTPVAFSAAERRLLDALRSDSRIDCAPRRTDLPPGSDAGIECRPGGIVARVGVYGFSGADPDPARSTYLARLAAAGVARGSGDCATGKPGDEAWPTYLPDEADDGGPSALRSGCFLDENGIANVRLTCYGPIYMGVLGTSSDVAALYRWSWAIAKGDSVHRDPPGLCASPD